MLKRTICGAAVVFACSHAHAAEKTMPINLVGEWCFSSQEDNKLYYRLPSWTDDGHCTKIFGIDPWGFSFNDWYCERLVTTSFEKDIAPSGTTYVATITARCMPPEATATSKLQIQTFKFERYKGNLWVTPPK
jgi:hypothetical protein